MSRHTLGRRPQQRRRAPGMPSTRLTAGRGSAPRCFAAAHARQWGLAFLVLMLAASVASCEGTATPASFKAPAHSLAAPGEDQTGAAASFELHRWEVVSEVDSRHQLPRACLVVEFTAAAPVSLVVLDPSDQHVELPQRFREGTSTAILPMTLSFLETPAEGRYVLEAATWYGSPVANIELSFEGADLAVRGTSFVKGDDVNPDKLDIAVANSGDLPAYVAEASVWIAGTHPMVSTESYVVLPGESTSTPFYWYTDGGLPEGLSKEADLRLFDGSGHVVAAYGAPPDESPVSDRLEIRDWRRSDQVDGRLDILRAYLTVDVETEVAVSVSLMAPDGRETGPPVLVTRGSAVISLPMAASATETPAGGTYSLALRRWAGDRPTTIDVASFEGANLSVSDVSLFPGVAGASSTLTLRVANEGSLPACVDSVDLSINGTNESVPGPATVIPPGESKSLRYRWIREGSPSGLSSPTAVRLDLKDGADAVLVTHQVRIRMDVMATYSSQSPPYAIAYPQDWVITEGESPGATRLTIAHPTREARVTIDAYRLPGQALDQWVNERNGSRGMDWRVYDLLSDERITWRDLPARRLTWLGRPGIADELTRVSEVCLASGDWRYSVRAASPETEHEEFAPQLEAILQRFSVFAQ